MLLAARRMTRPRLIPAGLALMFTFVSAASYYYAVVSVLVLCFHRRGPADTWGLTALMGAFAVGAAAVMALGGPLNAEVSLLWSMMLLGLSIIVLFSSPRST
jgi:hypothetical protein